MQLVEGVEMGIVEDALAQTVIELRERVRVLELENVELRRISPAKSDGKERKRERDKKRYAKRKLAECGGNETERRGITVKNDVKTAVFGGGERGESRSAALSPLPPPFHQSTVADGIPSVTQPALRDVINPESQDRDWRRLMRAPRDIF